VFLLWLLASLVAGVAVRPLVPERAKLAERESLAGLSGNLGQGITLATLGGYRNIAANLVWISMYGEWQYRRKSAVLEKMALAVSLRPESSYFWIDGARIIANDMPVWQVGDEQMQRLFDESDSSGASIRKEYAEQALRFLDEVPISLEKRYEIHLERGAIYWQRLHDLDRAIGQFEAALACEGVPYFVSRVYAELLYRNGQLADAYQYLKTHYAALPDEDRTAMKPLVAQRLQELARELRVRD